MDSHTLFNADEYYLRNNTKMDGPFHYDLYIILLASHLTGCRHIMSCVEFYLFCLLIILTRTQSRLGGHQALDQGAGRHLPLKEGPEEHAVGIWVHAVVV